MVKPRSCVMCPQILFIPSPKAWEFSRKLRCRVCRSAEVPPQFPVALSNTQLFLDLLQRHTFGLRNHGLHPNKLKDHHACKKGKNVTRRKRGDHLGEESCEQRGEDPVGEAAQSLTFRSMTIGKYLRDKYPDDRSLANRGRRNEAENAYWHD